VFFHQYFRSSRSKTEAGVAVFTPDLKKVAMSMAFDEQQRGFQAWAVWRAGCVLKRPELEEWHQACYGEERSAAALKALACTRFAGD
jgi:uncharacterized protein YfaT (DUF1175 family)